MQFMGKPFKELHDLKRLLLWLLFHLAELPLGGLLLCFIGCWLDAFGGFLIHWCWLLGLR